MIRTLFALALTLSAGAAYAEDAKPVPYPLDVCAVSGEALDSMDGPVTKVHEGREVKFCCSGCIKKFDKDPAKYLAAVDAKTKAAPAPAKDAKDAKDAKPAEGHGKQH